MQTAEHLARKAAEHGKNIFVYSNVRTNQVIYSLDKTLNNHAALQQLPFAGKKTIPSHIRKDMWRPFLTVSFPHPAQGLAAYRKLREYRKLHEVMWDSHNPHLTYASSDPKKMPSKKDRSKLIMDQKANTVADLAAVLQTHEQMSIDRENEDKASEEQRREEREKEQRELILLAKEADEGGIQKLEAHIADLASQVEALPGPDMQRTSQQLDQRRQLRKRIHESRKKLAKMSFAQPAVASARKDFARTQENVPGAVNQAGQGSPDGEPVVDVGLHIESYEPDANPPIMRKGRRRNENTQRKERVPAYTVDGVLVRWSNPLDAEYAEIWPSGVQHDVLGIIRHVAPETDRRVVLSADDRYMLGLEREMARLERIISQNGSKSWIGKSATARLEGLKTTLADASMEEEELTGTEEEVLDTAEVTGGQNERPQYDVPPQIATPAQRVSL
ncbi:hypothetical protein LTR66_002821 [Elasticomyces elasticus]|nr:hypothetical protein LTR66_002821 [Elasticomyces elasticus]